MKAIYAPEIEIFYLKSLVKTMRKQVKKTVSRKQKLLRYLRKREGITLRALSIFLEIDSIRLSNIENLYIKANDTELNKVLKALKDYKSINSMKNIQHGW